MARFRTELDHFEWYDIEATTSDSGRIYHTPNGDAPSVTTILSSCPNPELDAWRERVGEDEANRITEEACTIGTHMHDRLECLLKNEEYPDSGDEYEDIAAQMARVIQMFGWKRLNAVWAVEIPLHYKSLYAGRTDLLGLYDRKPAIMDYKTSKFMKAEKYLDKYRMQLAAYSLAAEAMFGQKFEYGVNFFAMRPNPEFRKPAESQISIIGPDEMINFKLKWIDLLMNFYQSDSEKLDMVEELLEFV